MVVNDDPALADVEALLRRTLEHKATDVAVPNPGLRGTNHAIRPGAPRRRWAAAAACVIVMAGAAGLVARSLDDDATPAAPASQPPPSEPRATDTPQPAATDDPADTVQWFLPTGDGGGYQLVDTYAYDPQPGGDMSDGATLPATMLLSPTDGDGPALGINVMPVDPDEPPPDGEMHTVDGRDYYVSYPSGETGEPYIEVTWIEAGRRLSILGGDDADVLIAVAATIEPVSSEAAGAVLDEVQAEIRESPTVAAATLAPGVRASVHQLPSGDLAMCVEGLVEECELPTPNLSGSADDPPEEFATFEIAGETRAIAWIPAELRPGRSDNGPLQFVPAGDGTQFATFTVDEPNDLPLLSYPGFDTQTTVGGIDVGLVRP